MKFHPFSAVRLLTASGSRVENRLVKKIAPPPPCHKYQCSYSGFQSMRVPSVPVCVYVCVYVCLCVWCVCVCVCVCTLAFTLVHKRIHEYKLFLFLPSFVVICCWKKTLFQQRAAPGQLRSLSEGVACPSWRLTGTPRGISPLPTSGRGTVGVSPLGRSENPA